jgi:uncharacterized alkaline shock family protein YloU
MVMTEERDLDKRRSDVEQEIIPDEVGSVKIADEVLSIVAGLAVSEISGVAGMSGGIVGGITEMLGKQNFSKGVKVITTGKTVTVEIYVIVKYGYNIPDVAIAIQEKVKTSIENMTGFDVVAVDVHVEGIRRQDDRALEKDLAGDDASTLEEDSKTEVIE